MPGRPGHLKLPNVRAGTHHVLNARDLPGGMLVDRIDSHIREQSEFKLEGGGGGGGENGGSRNFLEE